MGKKNKRQQSRGKGSYQRRSRNLEDRVAVPKRKIVFSLQYIDRTQGQTFEEWEKEGLLALCMKKLQAISSLSVQEAKQQQIVKEYSKISFPPKSDFFYPKHVPEGVKWCSLHIQGKECVIGYFEDFVFHIVFLDKDHAFWKTEKKHT